MVQAAYSLIADVERGPGWLLIKLGAPADAASEEAQPDWSALAESLWLLMGQHFTYRLVLECNQIALLDSTLIGQLLLLERRIRNQGGVVRLCGLSEVNQRALRQCRLESRLPHFANRNEAVQGCRALANRNEAAQDFRPPMRPR